MEKFSLAPDADTGIPGPYLKERKKNAEAWISGSGSVVHPTPQESQGVTADRQVEQVGEDEQRN